MQSRFMSVVESWVNILVGYGVAVVTQALIFPIFGINIPLQDNLLMGLVFTAISFIRSYYLRRLFNKIKQVQNEISKKQR